MRFTLSNFTDEDERTGEVCELYGNTTLDIPDIVVSNAKRVLQRALNAHRHSADRDALLRMLSEFRAYSLNRNRSESFQLYYDDSEYDCFCSNAQLYAELDYNDEPKLKVEFEVEYCNLYYDEDDEVTNYGEYDETDYITIDITDEILRKNGIGIDFRDSAAMVFTFNVAKKKDAVNDSEVAYA